ncbi:hypothetical protein Peur_039339 [Populus x canadensis]
MKKGHVVLSMPIICGNAATLGFEVFVAIMSIYSIISDLPCFGSSEYKNLPFCVVKTATRCEN